MLLPLSKRLHDAAVVVEYNADNLSLDKEIDREQMHTELSGAAADLLKLADQVAALEKRVGMG